MANAAGWNPSDKYADITLSSIATYLGTNVAFGNSVADNTWRSVRSVGNKSSGNWIFYFQTTYQSGNDNISWGIANGSFPLSSSINGDPNSYGIWTGGNLFYNGASTYTLPGSSSFNMIGAIAFNATDGRLYCRLRNLGIPGTQSNSDTGWIDWSGTTADPTNNSQGTNITGLGTPIYAVGSARNPANPYLNGFGNFGGWPPLTELIPIPSGYSLWDANYPYSMPAGHYRLNHTTTNIFTSQNNMRAYVNASGGTDNYASSLIFPAGKKVVWAVYFDSIQEFNTSGAAIINNVASATSASAIWRANGTTLNMAGATWNGVRSTFVVYPAYDDIHQTSWINVNGTWYGSGGGADPATNTAGIDVSGIGTQATRGPGIYLDGSSVQAATFNAGKLTDPFSLPSGFQWLESTFVAGGNRAFIIG